LHNESSKIFRQCKEKLTAEIKQAVKEMILIRAGKKKIRSAEDFLRELK